MSFLYPLFLAGIAAVGLPIVLHMIRRHTRKRITFSSLMFLRTTIPRFKNRSRIENLLLLILRCIILCLLAFGFSRPFFPREAADNRVRLGRRIVLLIDTSASMRRAGMWDRAISEAQSVLKNVSQTDRVCVMSFDESTKTLIGFEQWGALEPGQRASIVTEEISKLSPGWALTNLGNALVSAAEAIEDDQVNDEQQPTAMRQVVLISDLQEGSNLDAMHAYEWPEEMELVVKLVRCHGTTNAALQLVTNPNYLAHPGSDDPSAGLRAGLPNIRVTNSSDATAERFKLSWAYEKSAAPHQLNLSRNDTSRSMEQGFLGGTIGAGEAADVYVPPGHSIVVRAPARADGSQARKLTLTGDDHNFDNTLYLAPYLQQQVNILYIGSDQGEALDRTKPAFGGHNDSKGMLYYIRRVFGPTGALEPRVISRPGDKAVAATDIETANLIITAGVLNQENLVSFRRYLESGRTILLVMKSIDDAMTLAALAGIDTIESEEADVDRYAMLGRIEFKHPLLALFSEPRFGDFTQIHFWKYRKINIEDLPDVRVLARFDNGDPAWIELPVGQGTLLVMTCGWHPSDSQFALSSKFVPLLYSILEYGGQGEALNRIRPAFGGLAGQQSQYFVGDHIPIPHSIKAASARATRPKAWTGSDPTSSGWTGLDPPLAGLQVRKPDDSLIILDAGQKAFTQTDIPGIYTIESSAGNQLFAVNLPAKESQTTAMPIDELERFAVSLKQTSASSVEPPSDVSVVLATTYEERTGQTGQSPGLGQTPFRRGRYDNFAGLEYEQKVWRWVFIALLAVSLLELWLAGWLNRTPSRGDVAVSAESAPPSNLQGEQE